MRKYKICGFVQNFNELDKGNLERFIKFFLPLVDDLVIYDDSSNDGSYEYLINFIQKDKIIRGAKNDFCNEIAHKQILLEKVKNIKPDFILWLDIDEVLTCSREVLEEICQDCLFNNCNGVSFKEINLYRSESYKRLDSLFDKGYFTRLWKFSENLFYDYGLGLHRTMTPINIDKIFLTEKASVLHYGFSSPINLAHKYWTYKKNGQKGYIMLDRLIFSNELKCEKLKDDNFPCKSLLPTSLEHPKNLSFRDALIEMWRLKPEVTRPKFSIICLIYKDIRWLEFVYDQIIKYTNFDDKEFFFVVNDGTEEVKEFLKNSLIKHFILENTEEQKQEWYINNVYRAYNYGATKSIGEYLIFINSDMAFSPNWFENLWYAYNGNNCISSRLIESGKLKSGTFGIEKNFGNSFNDYNESEFLKYVNEISINNSFDGGLYMPLLIKKSHFIDVGMYPEGNILFDSDIFRPVIAKKGDKMIAGDKVLMMKLRRNNIIHQTAFNSIVYHFQCGEMDEKPSLDTNLVIKKSLAICNDYVTKGTMNENTLWSNIINCCKSSIAVDINSLNLDEKNYESSAKYYLSNNLKDIDLVFQNGTFMSILDNQKFNIIYVQDNLRRIKKEGLVNYPDHIILQQEENIKNADIVITNSIELIEDYNELNFDYLIQIGVDHELFNDLKDKCFFRKKHQLPNNKKIGIFVGMMNEVKGWSEMLRIIDENHYIHWIIVSKMPNEKIEKDNISFFTRISQEKLVELYNAADFFIITSKQETQCLAAIEAAMCNIPIIMYNTGFSTSLNLDEKQSIGLFIENDTISNQLEYFLSNLSSYNPRDMMIKLGFTNINSINKFIEIFSLAQILAKQKKQLLINGNANNLIAENNKNLIAENNKNLIAENNKNLIAENNNYYQELNNRLQSLAKEINTTKDDIKRMINRQFLFKRLIKNIKKESLKLFSKIKNKHRKVYAKF